MCVRVCVHTHTHKFKGRRQIKKFASRKFQKGIDILQWNILKLRFTYHRHPQRLSGSILGVQIVSFHVFASLKLDLPDLWSPASPYPSSNASPLPLPKVMYEK